MGTKPEGLKYDAGKPRLAEMFIDFQDSMVELSKVWAFGANKYDKANWKLVDDALNRYTNAMLRHLIAEEQSALDDESHMLHAAHVAWNALVRLHFVIENEKHKSEKTQETEKVRAFIHKEDTPGAMWPWPAEEN